MRQLKITRQFTNKESDCLNKYLHEISLEKLITSEEEGVLAQKIKQGDVKAMERLTKANLRFVVSVAKQYQNRGLPLSDLINEGNIGLIRAVQRFDATRGFKLISYAVWAIRQSIQHAIEQQSTQVRLPANKIDLVKKIKKTFIRMEQLLQREPSYEEMGAELHLAPEIIQDALNINGRQVSIDAPLNWRTDHTLMDLIADTMEENADCEKVNSLLGIELENVISLLPSREADVLRLYFGLNGKEPLTYKQIGDLFGFTSVRARQIKETAMIKLKHTPVRKVLREYLA